MASPEKLPKYDTALLGILQSEGELEPFLDVLFGFLFRKTDFYHVMKEGQQKYGFPEGVAEKIIGKYFKKYKTLTEKMVKQAEENRQKMVEQAPKEPPVQAQKEKAEQNEEVEQVQPATENKPELSAAQEVIKTQEQFQLNPDSYNGAVRDRYSWSQNYDDIDLLVPVDKSITKGRQVKVNIEKKRLYVSVTGTDGKEDVILNGELKHKIIRDDSMWSLEAGKNIQITLSKDEKFWWNAILVSEEEIDIQKIAPERSMGDMKEDEVAVINKLQFDEKQKRLGLPQSHEIKVHEMLKKGWDAEGSPFKGQEFDPKMFNISSSSISSDS